MLLLETSQLTHSHHADSMLCATAMPFLCSLATEISMQHAHPQLHTPPQVSSLNGHCMLGHIFKLLAETACTTRPVTPYNDCTDCGRPSLQPSNTESMLQYAAACAMMKSNIGCTDWEGFTTIRTPAAELHGGRHGQPGGECGPVRPSHHPCHVHELHPPR